MCRASRSVSKIACDRRSMRVADRAEDFRGAVDDRLDQSVEHRLRLVAAAAGLHGAGHEHGEGARLAVAHGDERPFGQDERDVDELRASPYRSCTGRAPSCSARCSRDRGSRTARYRPSPPGRDLDVEMALDEPVFLAGRLDQVDPEGVGRDRLARLENGAVEGLAAGPTRRRPVDHNHAVACPF